MGYAVAALARPQRERHLVVATPTIFTLQNLFHADGIGTRLGHEYLRVAITASEPTRMGEVREAHVRHLRRILQKKNQNKHKQNHTKTQNTKHHKNKTIRN